jgi:ankyrin repeat protein
MGLWKKLFGITDQPGGTSGERPTQSQSIDFRSREGNQKVASQALSEEHRNSFAWAASHGDLEKLKALLKEDPRLISSTNSTGQTPLHSAVFNKENGDKEVIEFLLENGAHVNAWDKPLPQHGGPSIAGTPLGLAVLLDNIKAVGVLLENGADINLDGPLHKAAKHGDPEMVELLVAYGADVNARDKYGNTVLETPPDKNRGAIEALLRRHGAVGPAWYRPDGRIRDEVMRRLEG